MYLSDAQLELNFKLKFDWSMAETNCLQCNVSLSFLKVQFFYEPCNLFYRAICWQKIFELPRTAFLIDWHNGCVKFNMLVFRRIVILYCNF